MQPENTIPPTITLPWEAIHTLLLDMDGTLLDRHFDDHFFLQVVPRTFAQQRAISREQAQEQVLAAYRAIEGTLAWYDLDHWSRTLGMDIPLLKREAAHLIQVHPQVIPFLEALRTSGRPIHLVTNAHARSLELKFSRTPISRYFTSVTSSHELGKAKEDPDFWPLLQGKLLFDPRHTLLVDDSEPVLAAAAHYGLAHLLHIAAPSSQLPPVFSRRFLSIADFSAISPPKERTTDEHR